MRNREIAVLPAMALVDFETRTAKWVVGDKALPGAARAMPSTQRVVALNRRAPRRRPEEGNEQAEQLYAKQFARREKSRLMPKGKMTDDWTRRYIIPTHSPDYAKWKAQARCTPRRHRDHAPPQRQRIQREPQR